MRRIFAQLDNGLVLSLLQQLVHLLITILCQQSGLGLFERNGPRGLFRQHLEYVITVRRLDRLADLVDRQRECRSFEFGNGLTSYYPIEIAAFGRRTSALSVLVFR